MNHAKIYLPPSRACNICTNRMNEVCVEKCAPEGLFKNFLPDMDRPLEMIPTLTFQEYMDLPGTMKGKWLFYQQTKILEALNGRETGSHIYRSRSRRLPQNLKGQDLLHGAERGDTPREDRPERENPGNGSKEVDRQTGTPAKVP